MKNQIKLIFLFVFIVFISGIVFSQNRWVKMYYDDQDAIGINIANSYDKGILIVGKHGHNYVNYNWLIKTDINGEILWEKTIGYSSTSIKISDMAYNNLGELYLVGLTSYYNINNYDPIIMKLDSCGEKEWCKVFLTERNSFSNGVVINPNGGCTVILRNMSTVYQTDRICLAKLSLEGELLWQHCYNSPDTNLNNENAYDLTITSDDGYLITGYCYYRDPVNPNLFRTKPYFIKTDSLGNFEWETIVHKEDSDLGGQAWTTVINPQGTFYYSSIRHEYNNTNTESPALLKIDFYGNLIDIFDIVSGFETGKLSYATFLNDSLLTASAGWGNDDLVSHAIIIDTMGQLLNSFVLMEDIYTSILQVTYDSKLVYMSNTFQNNQFDVYLRKLNQNLEDDTIYTYPFQYDTLCPYPIASDTIVQDDCGLIVGMEEVKQEKEEERDRILIYPNPAQNFINIEYPIMNYECRSIISIYDIYGRKVKEIKIPKGQNEVIVDVSKWNRGIYIAVLWQKGKLIAKEKFMIIR